MRGLANAAVEGLLVCDGNLVATVNNSFALLAGMSGAEIAGTSLDRYFPDEATRLKLFGRPNQAIEAELLVVSAFAEGAEIDPDDGGLFGAGKQP